MASPLLLTKKESALASAFLFAYNKLMNISSLNRVIKVLIFSDLILNSAFGLLAPVFAIFIINNIQGGDAKVAGIAVGTYWILKSILQIPIGNYLDRNHGEKDDFYFMIGGTFIGSLTFLGFIFASQPWHVYALQALLAGGMAMAIPSWGGIFTRHIDKGHEGITWSLESSSIGIGAGIAGIVGGVVVKYVGFSPLFIAVSVIGVVASLFLFLIKNQIVPRGKIEKIYPHKQHLFSV